MKDRTNEEGTDPVTDGPTDNARRRGESESHCGGKHGAPQERTMIEQILEPENLSEAWKRVRRNKGAPGIDGMTVEDFPAFAREHWPRIAMAIREGNHRTRSSGHESRLDRSSLRAESPSLIGTALYGAVRRVVWDPGANHSRGPDSSAELP